MTVSINDRRAGPFSGNGTNVDFTFDFLIEKASDIQVWKRDTTDANTLQVVVTNYTIPGSSINNPLGGTVTFVVAPLVTDRILLLGRSPLEQLNELDQGDTFYSQPTEDMFDRLQRQVQQHDEILKRMFRLDKFVADSQFPSIGFVEIPVPAVADEGAALQLTDSSPMVLAWKQGLFTDLIMFPATINKVTQNGGSSTPFTDIDISADTGTDTARFAILKVQCEIRDSGGNQSVVTQIRKDGITVGPHQEVIAQVITAPASAQSMNSNTIIIDLASEIFEYSVTLSGASTQLRAKIDLIGYIK